MEKFFRDVYTNEVHSKEIKCRHWPDVQDRSITFEAADMEAALEIAQESHKTSKVCVHCAKILPYYITKRLVHV